MPIRFLCPSCDNPIEIDTEWASQKVACHFCRNTVTAPAESTYTPPEFMPDARAVDPTRYGAPPDRPAAPTSRNTLATVALVLSMAWIASYAAVSWFFAPRIMEMAGPDGSVEEIQKQLQEQLAAGVVPPWLVALSIGMIFCALCWLGGLVCAILALRNPARRVHVIVAFAALSLGPVLVLFGAVGAR